MRLQRMVFGCLLMAFVGVAPRAHADQASFTVDFTTVGGPGGNNIIYFNPLTGSLGAYGINSIYLVGVNTPLNSGGEIGEGYTSFSAGTPQGGSGNFSYSGGSGTVGYTPSFSDVVFTLMGGTLGVGTFSGWKADFSLTATLSASDAAYFGMNPNTVYYGSLDVSFSGPPAAATGLYAMNSGSITFSNIGPSSVPEPSSLGILSMGLVVVGIFLGRPRCALSTLA